MSMQGWLNIDELILINQVAQGVHDSEELVRWFEGLEADRKSLVLAKVAEMIQHSRPKADDGPEAVKSSGLKSTATPCVLLNKRSTLEQIKKIARLPQTEQTSSLLLLINVFRIADGRRRSTECKTDERHWWHRDLADPKVLTEIRRLYALGQL